MRLSNDTYEEIKIAFANMVVDYEIKSYPIDPFELAHKIGLKIIPYSSLDKKEKNACLKLSEDGFSLHDERHWWIFYNDEIELFERIRQTIMHEIGHYFLGHTKEGEEEEAEAKFFAKYALSLSPLYRFIFKDITIDKIQKNFILSYEASVYAYKYHQKRELYGGKELTFYEKKIVNQILGEIA